MVQPGVHQANWPAMEHTTATDDTQSVLVEYSLTCSCSGSQWSVIKLGGELHGSIYTERYNRAEQHRK